ncbi:hypothetical protein [Streptomyces sp. NPDC051132]|uniref:hypothetical protein n=1 Tax=unclassified Streptomyces TaxID=2593676 RepID=UPI00344AB6E1
MVRARSAVAEESDGVLGCGSEGLVEVLGAATARSRSRGRPHQREKTLTLEVRAAMELTEAGAVGPSRPGRRRVAPRWAAASQARAFSPSRSYSVVSLLVAHCR